MTREWWDLPKRRRPKGHPSQRGMLFEEKFRYICNGCGTQAQAAGRNGPICMVCDEEANLRHQGGHRYTMDIKPTSVETLSQRPV